MRILILAYICSIFLVSCQNKDLFYIEHTKLTPSQLPKDCQKELIEKINTQWLKHGQSNCHYYNSLSQSFAMENMECVMGMEQEMLFQLLGTPDIKNSNEVIYYLDKECGVEAINKRNRIFRADIVFIISSELKVQDVIFRSKKGGRQ